MKQITIVSHQSKTKSHETEQFIQTENGIIGVYIIQLEMY